MLLECFFWHAPWIWRGRIARNIRHLSDSWSMLEPHFRRSPPIYHWIGLREILQESPEIFAWVKTVKTMVFGWRFSHQSMEFWLVNPLYGFWWRFSHQSMEFWLVNPLYGFWWRFSHQSMEFWLVNPLYGFWWRFSHQSMEFWLVNPLFVELLRLSPIRAAAAAEGLKRLAHSWRKGEVRRGPVMVPLKNDGKLRKFHNFSSSWSRAHWMEIMTGSMMQLEISGYIWLIQFGPWLVWIQAFARLVQGNCLRDLPREALEASHFLLTMRRAP